MKKTKPNILLIDWVDSVNNSGWLTTDECKADLLVCQTAGFLVDEDKDSICIALNRTTRKGYRPFGELISIPKVAVKARRILR
jgi:hypothetical protein